MRSMKMLFSWLKRTRTRLYYTRKYRVIGVAVFAFFLCVWWIVSDDDAIVETQMAPKKSKVLEPRVIDFINIVEDEDDAVKHWKAAASTGAILSSGNILLHFGAHTADASSHPREGYNGEFYRALETAFLKVSSSAGLISRFIWVFPRFLEGPHKWRMGDHVTVNIRIGNTHPVRGEGVQRCHCVEPGYVNFNFPCFKVEKATSGRDKSNHIDSTECTNITFYATVEFVGLDNAIKLSKSWNFKRPVLDINENMFGCELPSFAFSDINIARPFLVMIASYMKGTICLNSYKDEILADQMYFKILQRLIDISRHCKTHDKHKCKSKNVLGNILSRFITKVLEENVHVVCPSQQPKSITTREFASLLLSLQDRQLAVLRNVGLCLPSLTNNNDNDVRVRLCIEASGLTSDKRFRHVYTAPEARETARKLRLILRGIKFTPGVVTVSRSTRGGCTPRKQQSAIESSILSALTKAYTKRAASVHYDTNLLGGIPGWHFRYGKQ